MKLGKHLLVELYGCAAELLNDVAYIEEVMVRAAKEAGATVINTSFHHFSPYGVSGVVVIQESHLAIHSWPEHGFAAIDLFTCGPNLDPWISYESLKTSLQASHGDTREIERGTVDATKASMSPSSPGQDTTQTRNIWFTDKSDDIALSLRHSGCLYSEQSKFQKVEIFNTYGYGKMLVLDGNVTCTERDEFAYHEMIVHVPMFAHPSPETAIVIGGGDGGAARELLRHSLKSLTLVEIDPVVIEASKAHLPDLSSSLNDPRLRVCIADGVEFLSECESQSVDLILVDATHPAGPATTLFSPEFYKRAKRCLKPQGILVTQSEPPVHQSRMFRNIHLNLSQVFQPDHVHCFLACIPSYTTGMVSFSFASKGDIHPTRHLDPAKIESFAKQHKLRYYREEVHRAAFVLPSYIEDLLQE